MKRVLLIHWNADEADERVQRLKGAGYNVDRYSKAGSEAIRNVRNDPPDAFVIDLGWLPSHGRGVAVWLRQQKATRHVPIIFIEGDPEKTRVTRDMMPDATFTDWRRIRGALRRAIERPPEAPVVPGTMDSYAGTPLPKKLGIKPGSMVALLGAPSGFDRTLGKLPDDVRVGKRARGNTDVILLFVKSQKDLQSRLSAAARALVDGGRLWIVWPKKASGVVSDLSANTVRSTGLDAGLVDYKIGKIDETWSGLCFTQRREKRRR
jgi:CheY-like chemotaxis protein